MSSPSAPTAAPTPPTNVHRNTPPYRSITMRHIRRPPRYNHPARRFTVCRATHHHRGPPRPSPLRQWPDPLARPHASGARATRQSLLRRTRSPPGPRRISLRCALFPRRARPHRRDRHRPTHRSTHTLGDDNLWHGLKATIDGFQDARVVANDPQFQMGEIIWEKAKPTAGHVILTLTPFVTPPTQLPLV